MNILIVEDENRSALRLQKLLVDQLNPDNLQIFIAKSIDTGLSKIENQNIDLLFLDLNLGGEDGFELLQQLVSQPFHTIVVSAYAERAIEAFEYGVLDFVPKPVMKDRLQQAVNRFINDQRSANKTKFLVIKKSGVIEKIITSEIRYLHAEGHYTEIFSHDKNPQLHDKSLEKLLMILPSNFERTHKSYIVNFDFILKIHSYSGSRYELELKDKTILPLGRSFAKEIKNRLLNSEKAQITKGR